MPTTESRPKLTHVALHVRNLDACVAFYQRYCGLHISQTHGEGEKRVVWLATPGDEHRFVIVVIPGGPGRVVHDRDFSHLGFALDSRDAVDRIARQARDDGTLVWEPRNEPWPVGYYCGLRDPDGNAVEFSYGQPLGPEG